MSRRTRLVRLSSEGMITEPPRRLRSLLDLLLRRV